MYNSIAQIQAELSAGRLTCEKLVAYYLDRIGANKDLNAFLEVYAEESKSRAKEIDARIKSGKGGRLAGLVIGIKDNICYKDHQVSAASRILEGFVSVYSATVVERLLSEDAIIIGRLNCDEFAMGSSNEYSAFGKVLNPLDRKRVPGGSSGGSAAAVAAGLCLAALGSDTGGSVRQPASFCGLVGFKPSYGRVSRYGLIAYGSSFDQISPFTKNVDDLALIMQVIAGKDGKDATASSREVPDYLSQAKTAPGKCRVAYISECMESSGLDPEIRAELQRRTDQLKKEGHKVGAVSLPMLEYLVPAYYVLTTAEASSNLSRYSGMLYGYRSPQAKDVESAFVKSRSEGFGKEVKRRIMLGTFVLSAGYYDAYYARAQKVRRLLQDKVNDIFKEYDFILLPTTPITAFISGEIGDPVAMYLQDIFTVLSNLTGHPSISLPLGKHSNGLPFGIQLMGRMFEEGKLFSFSRSLDGNN